MIVFKKIWNILQVFLKNLIKRIELRSYNEYTIAKYFRKMGAQIGDNCRIYKQELGGEPYLVKIGNHCTITLGVKFITHDGGCWIFREEIPNLNRFGIIEIEDNCFIGLDSIIMPNVKIGKNSIIGAGSVVTKDIPDGSIAVGVPAKVIGKTEEFKEKVIEEWKILNLKGNRSEWKEQLIKHYWGDSYFK